VTESDYSGLPEQTIRFVERLLNLGFDRERVFGLFTLVGLYAGSPNTQDKLEELYSRLQSVLPIDRSTNIDELVGHVYGGYERKISEFCYRSGLGSDFFDFREIKIPNVDKPIFVLNPKDEGVLATDIRSVDKLSDATQLLDAFLFAVGKRSSEAGATLLQAFQCGVFQIQLFATSDIHGAMQVSNAIGSLMPPFFGRCFYTAISGQVDYFLGLEPGQIALLGIMQEMESDYAREMWGFQSSLFYRDQQALGGIDKLTLNQWHEWVVKNAEAFSEAYPSQLLPLCRSNITLSDLPIWNESVRSFEACNQYINTVWGYSARLIENTFQSMEYKALIAHVVYSSLTSSRETLH